MSSYCSNTFESSNVSLCMLSVHGNAFTSVPKRIFLLYLSISWYRIVVLCSVLVMVRNKKSG